MTLLYSDTLFPPSLDQGLPLLFPVFSLWFLLLPSKVVGEDVARAALRPWVYKTNDVHSVGGNCFY